MHKTIFLPSLEFFFQSDLQEIINALYDMVWKMWVCLSVRFSNFGYLMIFTHIFSIPISHKMHFMHAYLYIHQFWSSLSAHVKLQYYVQSLTKLDHPNVKCRFNMTQLKSTHMCLVNDKKNFPKNLINIIIFYFVCLANWTVFLPTTIFFFTQTSICQTDKLCAKQKRLVFH